SALRRIRASAAWGSLGERFAPAELRNCRRRSLFPSKNGEAAANRGRLATLNRSWGETLLLHAGHIVRIDSASQSETIAPFFAVNLCLAIDIGSLKSPRVCSLSRINRHKICRRWSAACST